MLVMISGCQVNQSNNTNNEAPIVVEEPPVVKSPPKLRPPNWKSIFTPLVDELLETAEVSTNNQLLISDVKNNSNGYVSSTQINKILFDLLANQNIFNVTDKVTVNVSKHLLGISDDDKLVSRSKMIALARSVEADYVLFTTINQIPKSSKVKAEVEMELLLVKTGEIVWQFSSDQLVNNQTVKQ